MKFKNYCVGFLFDTESDSVLLIKKNRPEWMKGLLNGIGGHIEKDESPLDAMRREFNEETGNERYIYWKNFCVLHLIDADIHFYLSYYDFKYIKKESLSPGEELIIIQVSKLNNYPIVNNLKWLINLALEKNISNCPIHIHLYKLNGKTK